MKRFLAAIFAASVFCCAFAGCADSAGNPNCFHCAGSNRCFLCDGTGFNYISSHDYRNNVVCVDCNGSGLCSQCNDIAAALKICPICKGAARCAFAAVPVLRAPTFRTAPLAATPAAALSATRPASFDKRRGANRLRHSFFSSDFPIFP